MAPANKLKPEDHWHHVWGKISEEKVSELQKVKDYASARSQLALLVAGNFHQNTSPTTTLNLFFLAKYGH